jgi:hypothetical protein
VLNLQFSFSFHDGTGYGEEKWGCNIWAPVKVYRGLVLDFNSEAMTWQVNFQFLKSCRCRRRLIGQLAASAPSRGAAESANEYEFEFDESVDDALIGNQTGKASVKTLKQVLH